jgi:hypothetical protein
MIRPAILALVAALAAAAPAIACAQQVGELVVTAERREGGESQPHAVLIRRADNLITDVQVNCDTRDAAARLAEVKATLANMIAAAAQSGGAIELSIESEDEGVLVPLNLTALDGLLKPGPRPDTSQVTIVVKTHITATDTFAAATGRIEGFVKKTKVDGRTLVARIGDWQLTVISPGQYHADIVAAIAQEAQQTMKPFGSGYGVTLTGLERPVCWNRSGPLELALYIPYAMTIGPAR